MPATACVMRRMTSAESSEPVMDWLTATRSRSRAARCTASPYIRACCMAIAARAANEVTSARFSSFDRLSSRERTTSTPSRSSLPARMGTDIMRTMPVSRAQSEDRARGSPATSAT